MLPLLLALTQPNIAPAAARAIQSEERALDRAAQSPFETSYWEISNELQWIIHKYGPLPEAYATLTRCDMTAGHYDAALADLSRAWKSKRYLPLCKQVLGARQISREASIPDDRKAVQVQAVGRRHVWAVVTADKVPPDPDDYSSLGHIKIQVVDGAGEKSIVSKPIEVYIPKGEIAVDSVLAPIWIDGQPGFALDIRYLAGDSTPNNLHIYRYSNGKLEHLAAFRGIAPPDLISNGKNRPVEIGVVATWKVYWTDVYRWQGSRFVFANRGYQHDFGGLPPDKPADANDPYYLDWVQAAVIAANRHQWRSATTYLRRAEKFCRLSVIERRAHPSYQYAAKYPDHGFSGRTYENLVDIRKRLHWIAAKDYNHALLYRPYDFDLRVPPYKLGHAGDHYLD